MSVEPTRIEPFEVVDIGTGARYVPAYAEELNGEISVYRAEALKKDGTPKAYSGISRRHLVPEADSLTESALREIRHSGHTWINNYHAARINEEREAAADKERALILRLQREIEAAKERLLDLYRVHGDKDVN